MKRSSPFAGFWRRLAAYLIDAIPITIIMALTVGPLVGLPEATRARRENPRDPQVHAGFLKKRNSVRQAAALVLVLYGTACEGSLLQGTIGKRLLGMKVLNTNGGRLGFGGAVVRNFTKLLSMLPAFLGCIWAGFDRRKQAWHDKLGGSIVVKLPRRHPLLNSSTPPMTPERLDMI